MNDKREMIGRVLGSLLMEQYKHELIDQSGIIGTLTEQAIVVECEVGHIYTDNPAIYSDQTHIDIKFPGIGGAPGKALAIILSLEKE